MNNSKEKYFFRRKQYLINQDFQFRYIGLFVGLAAIIFLIFSITTRHYINLNLNPLIESGMLTPPVLTELIHVEKNFLSKNLLTVFLILISIMTLGGVFVTHRIAGPLFALKRRMQEISHQGLSDRKLHVRRTDEFQDLIETFNEMISSLQKQQEKEKNKETEKAA